MSMLSENKYLSYESIGTSVTFVESIEGKSTTALVGSNIFSSSTGRDPLLRYKPLSTRQSPGQMTATWIAVDFLLFSQLSMMISTLMSNLRRGGE